MLTSRSENGAVLLIFALVFVMLIGFMALAVDSAYAFSERRSSQSAADIAAVGGALQVIDHNGAQSQIVTDLVNKTMALATSNVSGTLDWENCQDPEKFAENATNYFSIGDSQYTECISWESDFSEVRVKLPNRDIPTFFARVIGFDSVSIGAFAEVTQVIGGGGGVLPFGLLGGGPDGLVCLKTGPSFPIECDPNSSGNFNFLDFYVYGNTAMDTVSSGCSGGELARLKENISHGIDHDLAALDLPWPNLSDPEPTHKEIGDESSVIKEDVQCADNSTAVHAARTETGNKQKVIIDGFVEGNNGWPGRLTIGSPSQVYTYGTVDIDDVGLWQHLIVDMDTSTPVIDANPCAAMTNEGDIINCVNANSGQVLFKDTIASSARFAKVPSIHQTTWPSGSKYVSFESFKFVYIQTLYGGCGSGSCNLEIRPAETYRWSSDDPVVVTAIVLPDDVISDTVHDAFGVVRVTTYAITR